ncbi:hypothetical protein FBZ93_103431 [Bradyrhizobium macuxiense]|uniref:Uncharacterized protein n=1 Tax=Bradyrhizobium macuxiense TaxID=1755647 RepID=A0A560MCT0_9BRAD|nr:hypothetical protein [Bradyrhizobium macuxiense]TWC05414.1 hypothetical protein FBZ93_103431 [Bradyrhizobium macuxiense]
MPVISTIPAARLPVSVLAIMLLTLAPACAEKMSKRQQAVVKHIKAECKAKAAEQAKGYGFVERWRAYSDCVHDAAKNNAGLDFADFD